jgi:hypothetical protein
MDLKTTMEMKEILLENQTLKKKVQQLQRHIDLMDQKSNEWNLKQNKFEREINDLKFEIQELKSKNENHSATSGIYSTNTSMIDLNKSENESDDEEESMDESHQMPLVEIFEPMFVDQNDPKYVPNEQRKSFPFPCPFGDCDRAYLQKKRLDTHIIMHHRNEVPTTTVVKPKFLPLHPKTIQHRKRGNFACNFKGCNFTATYKPAFVRHVKTHKAQFECDLCDYITPYEKRFSNHLYSKHGSPTDYQFADGEDDKSGMDFKLISTSTLSEIPENKSYKDEVLSD